MPKCLPNPMNYFCAPNGATPDYVAAHDMEDFIAYGLVVSFIKQDDINSNIFIVTDEHIADLRKGFLRCLEITASMLPYVGRGEQADMGSHGTGTTIFPVGFDPASHDADDAADYLDIEWRFDCRDAEGHVCLVLTWASKTTGFLDDTAIWIDSRCFNNRARLAKVIAKAQEAIKLTR